MTSDIGIAVSKSSETMDITLTNNGSVTAYITKLQARGTAISADDPASIRATDSTSQRHRHICRRPGQYSGD